MLSEVSTVAGTDHTSLRLKVEDLPINTYLKMEDYCEKCVQVWVLLIINGIYNQLHMDK